MQRKRLVLLTAVVLMLNACSDSDVSTTAEPPSAQDYTATLTEVSVVKQGSDEEIAIDDLPANGAILTRN